MTKQNFTNLLTDLYTIYNPSLIPTIEGLVEKYNGGLEFDSAKIIFIKYNHPKSNLYDPQKNEDSYILKLIKEYDKGNRLLQGINVEEEIRQKRLKEEKEKEDIKKGEINIRKNEIENLKNESQKKIEEQYQELIKYLDKKYESQDKILKNKLEESEKILEQYNNQIEKMSEIIKDDTSIRIISNYTDTDLILPNKKFLAGLGAESRIIVFDSNKKIIGLVIKDITCDFVTNSEMPTIEITVDKL